MAFLDRYRPGLRAQVRERMPPDDLERFETAARTAFLPLEVDSAFVQAMYDVLGGREHMARAVQASVSEHFEGPLLRTVVGSARRLFGMTPMGLLKMLPRGWNLVYRDLATPSLGQRGERHATFLLEDVTPELYSLPGYPASFEGILLGIAEVTGEKGAVLARQDSDTRRMEFTLHW